MRMKRKKKRKKKSWNERQNSCKVIYKKLNELRRQHVTEKNERKRNNLAQGYSKEDS